jgi:catechol 2,3-dioxygenase-like lactoylglutathione lyase family enzyme
MITGAHVLLYSQDADADRAFFRDILGFRSVDVGGGWLIFALPPSEMAVHPADHHALGAELYLMCDDLSSFVKALETKNVASTPFTEADWGTVTTIRLPSGARLGVYQPKHPRPV